MVINDLNYETLSYYSSEFFMIDSSPELGIAIFCDNFSKKNNCLDRYAEAIK